MQAGSRSDIKSRSTQHGKPEEHLQLRRPQFIELPTDLETVGRGGRRVTRCINRASKCVKAAQATLNRGQTVKNVLSGLRVMHYTNLTHITRSPLKSKKPKASHGTGITRRTELRLKELSSPRRAVSSSSPSRPGVGRTVGNSFARVLDELCVMMARLSLADSIPQRRPRRLSRRRMASSPRKTEYVVKRAKLDPVVDNELVGMLSHMSLESPRLEVAEEAAEEIPVGGVDEEYCLDNINLEDEQGSRNTEDNRSSLDSPSCWPKVETLDDRELYDEGNISLLSSCSSTSTDTDEEDDIEVALPDLPSTPPCGNTSLALLVRSATPHSVAARIGTMGIRNGSLESPAWPLVFIQPARFLLYHGELLPDMDEVD